METWLIIVIIVVIIAAASVWYFMFYKKKQADVSSIKASSAAQTSQPAVPVVTSPSHPVNQPASVPTASLIIKNALYGASGGSVASGNVKDVTAILNGYVTGNKIDIETGSIGGVYNEIFGGDPAINAAKTLAVTYEMRGITHFVVFNENDPIKINA